MITQIEFVAPRSVSCGELVMDPNTGRWGFASRHYDGGQTGTFSAGSGYVVSVSGAVPEGADLFCRNGIIMSQASNASDTPCASVVSVLGRGAAETSVLVRLY